MSTHPTLDLSFTPELRSRVETFLASINEYKPTLVLMKGRRLPYSPERWDYGAYGPGNVQRVGAELQRVGKTLLFVADGIVVAVPQSGLLDELTGKTLGLGTRGLIVIPRKGEL